MFISKMFTFKSRIYQLETQQEIMKLIIDLLFSKLSTKDVITNGWHIELLFSVLLMDYGLVFEKKIGASIHLKCIR